MSNIEALELRRRALDDQISAAAWQKTAESLRASFTRLVDPSLPVCDIIRRVLAEQTEGNPALFATVLAETIKAYATED